MRAELIVEAVMIALGEQVQIDLPHDRAVAIRINDRFFCIIPTNHAQAVIGVARNARQDGLEKAFVMQPIGRHFAAVRDHPQLLRIRPKSADDQALPHPMRTKYAERVRMRAAEEDVHLIDRQAEDFEGTHVGRSLVRSSAMETADAERAIATHLASPYYSSDEINRARRRG